MMFSTIEIPDDHIFYKSNYSYAFVNLKPFLPYHILISPIRCVRRLNDLSDEEYNDIFNSIRIITNKLNVLGTSFTITLQDGEEAGQTVKHLHFHIIPRNKNDISNNNDIYKGIAVDCDRKPREYKEMKEEAELLRNLFLK